VPELTWTPQSPLGPAFAPGRSGEAEGEPGVRLSVVSGVGIFQVMARRGQWQATARAAESCFGARPPERPGASLASGLALVWSGPDQFMALTAPGRREEEVRTAFAEIASVSDQSHGRILFRVSGPSAVDTLAKVSSVDLDPLVFHEGSAAMTSIDHTGVTLWGESAGAGGEPAFSLLVFTSFAGTLWRLLVDSAAEFGVESAVGTFA
jgi:heterotetrameric sarcosine oxidase gamma subunit